MFIGKYQNDIVKKETLILADALMLNIAILEFEVTFCRNWKVAVFILLPIDLLL